MPEPQNSFLTGVDAGGAAGTGVRVYRVSELLAEVKHLVQEQIGYAWVEGEVSDFRRPTSGHIYFALKDERARLHAAYFRGRQQEGVTFRDGDLVRVFGLVSVYEGRSEVQIVVEQVMPQGRGALLEKFEQLKRRLEAEGLFDPRRKKPIPLLPRRIGIVTSPTGAALRDIFNVLGRRFSGLGVVIAPARVQGEGAAEEIAEGVRQLNAYGAVDVIIVTRGGGGLDDLWCFNEESVARAIAASRIPVISAVGHEIDYTIADFAADLRAPTPSAAAELVVGRKAEFHDRIKGLAARLDRSLRLKVAEMRARFNRVARSYVFREPGHLVGRYRQRVSHCREICLLRLKGGLADRRRRVDDLESELLHAVELRSRAMRETMERLRSRLAAVNPSAVLARGYSLTLDGSGRALLSAEQVRAGEEIVTVLYRGRLKSVVRETMEEATPRGQEEPDEDRP